MRPNASKHETAFVIEPQSGIPISVKARFQVNILVDQLNDVDLFKHVPRRTFFPVIWFESKFDLADSLDGQMWLDEVLVPWERVFLVEPMAEPVARWGRAAAA